MRAERLAVIVSLILLATIAAPVAAQPSGTVAAGRYIVVFNDAVGDPAAAAGDLARQHRFNFDLVYRHALKGFAAAIPAGRVAALQRDPRVAYVEADQVAHISAQTVPTGIQRIFADTNSEIDIDGSDDFRVDVDVAIIDTGIDLDHPDLNVVASTNCSGGSPFRSRCGTGGDDDNGHGTHVAGTVAAVDNGLGVVGVAPGARLWAVKVLSSSGSGKISWIVAGIDYVTANAASIEVANMSLGCECSSAAMDDAIARSVDAGVAYAVAAGNNDADASTHSPANHPDVLTVSALADFDGDPGGLGSPTCRTDDDDTLANFSNFGAKVEIAAPGVCILSSVPGGGYDTFSGTSMASPHAAGALALLASGSGDPINEAQVKALYGTLVTNGNFNWTDDSGDSIKEPLLDVSNATVFNPALVAGSGGGGGGEPNNLPTADDTTANGSEDTTIAWQPLVADPDAGDVLSCSIASQPANGSAGVQSDCSSGTYTANANFSGVDSFTYAVSDGKGGSDNGTVSVTVTAVNDAPVATDDAYSTPKDTTLVVTAPGVLANDTDVDGDSLTASLVSGPASGSLTLSGTGSFSYTPNAGFTGTDSFTYEVSDGSATDTGTVTITVGAVMKVTSIANLGSVNNGSTWTARVQVTITDANGNPVSGATVDGNWTYNGTTVPDSCNSTTNDSGQCVIDLAGIPKRVSSATSTVTSVSLASFTWDGVEKSLTVFKP